MTWTKLGDEFGPESAELTDAEFRTHIEALVFSSWRLLDLYVPKIEVRRFACSAAAGAAIRGLVAKAWWQDAGPNWYIGVRFAEWQQDRMQVEHRRQYLAAAQRRSRRHKLGDHSLCLPSCSERRSTVDPGRDGTVTGKAVRPKGNSSIYEHSAASEAGLAAPGAEGDGKPAPPQSRKTGGITTARITAVHDDQQIPVNGSAGASHQTVTRAKTGRPPLPEPKRQAILALHAQGGLTLKQIAAKAEVAISTAHKVIHAAAP